ncbi:MAG: flagellar biosynthesis protein FlgL [Sulfurimonas sp.]|nr:flagellar biosynthesis protein FlgL [Sulfurimonas sp.]
MRIMNSMYYNNLSTNHSKINQNLFDVNKQIASGLKIQYASDNVSTFVETMRLDNELATLGQVKKSADSGYKVSNQTDVTLNEFTDELDRMKVLLIQASNDTNDESSLDAIAGELRAMEGTLKSLSNASINGKFLFSGSSVNVKPIDDNGKYNGNDISMTALLGSNNKQPFNISGADLFLGEESLTRREVTSNVMQTTNTGTTLTGTTTMADYMGNIPVGNEHNFYLRGSRSDGTAFNTRIPLDNTSTIDDLMDEIGKSYGNTGTVDVVNVSMNNTGQIIVADKSSGSSKMEFHMVGASDFSAGGDQANVTSIDDLVVNGGVTDYSLASTTPGLYIREFNQSPYEIADTVLTSLSGRIYDRTEFTKAGATLASSIAQIDRTTNAFATPSTKISEVADLSQGIPGTLDGTKLIVNGTNTSNTPIAVEIDFSNVGSTFSIDGGLTNYEIYDMSTPRAAVNADDMTYQQLMDVVNMVISGTIPSITGDPNAYDTAVKNSNNISNTYLENGKLNIFDKTSGTTKASISLYDSNSGNFTVGGDASVMTFNSNNSLTVRDPKTDFFATISEAIKSVEEYKTYPDTSSGTIRNLGVENSIATIGDLQKHLFKIQSISGAQSNRLTSSIENTELLELSAVVLRSEVIDTDLAKAALHLQQLTLNQQAMLSTVGKVSKLSLVNYL